MNIEQNNKLRAAQATIETMTTHKPKWEEITGIVEAVASVESIVEGIIEQSRAQSASARSGHGAAKAELFQSMVDAAFTVCSGLKAFAAATENIQLFAQVDFSRTDVARGREADVVNRCQTLWDLGTANAAPLAEKYHVDAADLRALKTAITDFSDVQPKPRQSRAAVSAATAELVKFFNELDEVLYKQLDPLIEKFKTIEPAFYQEYQTARSIVDSVASQSGAGNNVVTVSTSAPAPTSEPVPKAA
jgi:hypothetical protein